MEMLRRQFGIAEPVRRGMELKITEAGEWRPAVLGGSSGVHKDILEGRDTEIGWEDVFTGTCTLDTEADDWVVSSHAHGYTNTTCRQRASPSARLPYRDAGEAEDELVVYLLVASAGQRFQYPRLFSPRIRSFFVSVAKVHSATTNRAV